MIGFLQGQVLFSDGHEIILLTNNGIGHQVYFNHVLAEGAVASIFVSHIVKESSEEMYGFQTLREKKLFEMLTTVKGIGPKSGFALVSNISPDELINAILFDDKKTITKAPGVGPKAAAQVILDLQGKIQKVKMYSNKRRAYLQASIKENTQMQAELFSEIDLPVVEQPATSANHNIILNETIMACKELGFREDKIIPLAQKILASNQIQKAEQLVHLVLKEI